MLRADFVHMLLMWSAIVSVDFQPSTRRTQRGQSPLSALLHVSGSRSPGFFLRSRVSRCGGQCVLNALENSSSSAAWMKLELMSSRFTELGEGPENSSASTHTFLASRFWAMLSVWREDTVFRAATSCCKPSCLSLHFSRRRQSFNCSSSNLQSLTRFRISGRQSDRFRSSKVSLVKRWFDSERVVRSWLWEEPVGSLIPATWSEVRCGQRLSTDVTKFTSVWTWATLTVSFSRSSSAVGRLGNYQLIFNELHCLSIIHAE